jgi:hypothetical protein
MAIFQHIERLRTALVGHGVSVANLCGPVTEHWDERYVGCLGHFYVEATTEDEHSVYVTDAWSVIVRPDGTIHTALPPDMAVIVREWTASFTQTG